MDSSATKTHTLSLSLLILAWGVQAIVTQAVLVREAIVLMAGSEFAWGVVLFAWLLGIASGAPLGSRLARQWPRPEVLLAAVLLALGIATVADLWIFRGARAWFDIRPGELLALPTSVLVALLFIPPTSLFIGMAFPLACSVRRPVAAPPADAGRAGFVLSFARVYALESAGGLIGGAAFSFWAVERISPIQTVLLCGALTTACTTGLFWHHLRKEGRPSFGCAAADRSSAPPIARTRQIRRRIWGAVSLATIAVAFLLTALLAGSRLDRLLVERRWATIAPGYRLVAESESRHQNLALGVREQQYSLYCNGQIAGDFPDPYTYVPLAHLWMCQHPLPRRVLVLGGGAEGLLSEVLSHPVEHVDYVEPDPKQIELIAPFLAEADRRALDDARVTVHHQDARYFIKMQRDRFDLVIARLPEPTSAFRARFYTEEFFGELHRAMTASSVLCMAATASPGELSAMSAEYLASLRTTILQHFPFVTICWGDPAHVLAATMNGLTSTNPAELTRRYEQRNVQSSVFDPLWFEATDWLDADKIRRRAGELDAATNARISTDLCPFIYVQRLVLWERMTGRPAGGFIERLRTITPVELAGGLAALAAATLLVCRLRSTSRAGAASPWASGAIVLSVATTGFATMALSIIWLFAFQNLYGYVYQRIGWIVALFMAGLVIGCLAAERSVLHMRRGGIPGVPSALPRLIAVDLAIALLALAAPRLIVGLGRLQDTAAAFPLVEQVISLMVCLTGILCGAAFPLAGALCVAGGTGVEHDGSAAGIVVSSDHAGACLGALLTGILLVPVFGTAAAAYLLMGAKLVSAVALLASAGRGATTRHP